MPHVVRHTDTAAFLAAAQPVLARSEAAAAAFAAWTRGLSLRPPPGGAPCYLATYAHDGRFGAAMRRPPDGPLVFEDSDPDAAAAFATDLAADVPRLAGVVGALPACEAFARVWRERTGRAHALKFHLRHHRLTEVAPVPPAPGAARVAVTADADWLVETQHAFLRDVGVADSPERIVAALPERIARGEYRIWDDGGPVAFAGWSDAGHDAARIAPVYTVPSARGRGYATALVAALAQALLAAGRRRLFLVTDVANPTSNAIYARIGFRPETDIYHFDLVDPLR
jgi:predicted GNAT family acetyltransferase